MKHDSYIMNGRELSSERGNGRSRSAREAGQPGTNVLLPDQRRLVANLSKQMNECELIFAQPRLIAEDRSRAIAEDAVFMANVSS